MKKAVAMWFTDFLPDYVIGREPHIAAAFSAIYDELISYLNPYQLSVKKIRL